VTMRMTPNWHWERSNRVALDLVNGDATSGLAEKQVTSHGFDLSGLDILALGTLHKNISFALVPSADETGAFHFESAWVRFDNLLGSRWLNLKMGKHELDMPEALSEKRGMTLSASGGGYQSYHFDAPGSANDFGIGDNQLGVELSGHSRNSYTRYAVDVMSSNSGNVDFTTNFGSSSGNTYDVYAHVSQAFQLPRFGIQRFGVLGAAGKRPTYFLTANGDPVPGTPGLGNASFSRFGAYATFYVGRFDYTGMWFHGNDNRFLATATPKNVGAAGLPAGARDAIWNGGINELHFTVNPQLILVGRYELIRMSQQALPAGTIGPSGLLYTPDLGNTNSFAIAYRWYPIMFSRAGFAWHQEFSRVRIVGFSPVTGSNLVTNSFFSGLDFDF
jgi:hypothetical protein